MQGDDGADEHDPEPSAVFLLIFAYFFSPKRCLSGGTAASKLPMTL